MKRTLAVLVLGVLVSTLAGCHLPPPICETSRITYPEVYSPPSHRVIESLRPTVQWIYLDPTCIPETYRVVLKRNTSDLYTSSHWEETVADETVPGSVNSWTPSFDLQPLQEYTYDIEVHYTGGILGSSTTFFTGPRCLSKHMLPPLPRAPGEGAVVNPRWTRGVILEWEYADDCLPDGYHLQVSNDRSFVRDASYFYDFIFERPYVAVEILTSSSVPSTGIPRCDTYYWHVAARLGGEIGGEDSTYSTTRSFYLAGEDCPLLTLAESIFLVNEGAFCRSGPGTLYDANATVEQGSQLQVQGRNRDASWFYVLLPDSRSCWISASVGQLQGDPSQLKEMAPPPLPEPTLTPTGLPSGCSQYNANSNICIAHGCKWDPVGHPNSPCVDP